jgi:hypothetical protein
MHSHALRENTKLLLQFRNEMSPKGSCVEGLEPNPMFRAEAAQRNSVKEPWNPVSHLEDPRASLKVKNWIPVF